MPDRISSHLVMPVAFFALIALFPPSVSAEENEIARIEAPVPQAEDNAPPPPLVLSSEEDIADAVPVNDAIDAMSAKVANCIKAGEAPEAQCQCKFPEDYAAVRTTYDAALEKHPDWADMAISYTLSPSDEETRDVTISFGGLRRQFESGPCAERTPAPKADGQTP